MEVYLYLNDQQVGPYTLDQIKQFVDLGQVQPDAPAWHSGLPNWSTVADLLQSQAVPGVPPAVLSAEIQPELDVNCLNRRVFGGIIDNLFFSVVASPLVLVVLGILKVAAPNFEGNIALPLGVLLSAPFVAYFISSRFQATPGMMLLGVVAVDLTGNRIGYGRALLRHLMSLFSFIFLIGFLMWNFNKKRQTLHDKVAGTLVIRKPPEFQPGKSPWLPALAMFIPAAMCSLALLVAGAALITLAQDAPASSASTPPPPAAVVSSPNQVVQPPPPAPTNAAPIADTSTAAAAAPASDDDLVNQVKDGTLDFDNTVKIGPALEGCSFLKNVTWKSFQTPQGRKVVEATGIANLEAYKNSDLDDQGMKLPADWVDAVLKASPSLEFVYTAQFEMSQTDDTIQVGYSGYTLKGLTNAQTGQPVSTEIKDDSDFAILKSFFANHPDTHVSAFIVALSQASKGQPSTAH